MKNKINKSGVKGETRMEEFLIQNNFTYIRHPRVDGYHHTNCIDFIVEVNGKNIYMDVKNQHGHGGRDGHVGYQVNMYKGMYGYDEVYIVEGTYDYPQKIKDFCNKQVKTYFKKFDEMTKMLLEMKKNKNKACQISAFMRIFSYEL